MPKDIFLNVHELVDFLLREGDIDDRVYSLETMLKGSLLHRTHQKKQKENYISEYPLKGVFAVDDYIFHIDGRADGLIKGEIPVIEEIKSTVMPLEQFHETQSAWHLGQAICYAALYLQENEATEKVLISLLYLAQESNEKKEYHYLYSKSEIQEKFLDYLRSYIAFLDKKSNIDKIFKKSAKELKFPFDKYRSGQKELMARVYQAIKKEETLFIEAPTGIGKTISTIYPTLKEIAEREKTGKLFFFTSRTSGQKAVEETINILFKNHLKSRVSILQSKERICLKKDARCNPDECPFATSYYSKLREVRLNLLEESEIILNGDEIKKIAMDKKMCPFELQLDLSEDSNIIVADCNYLFDPIVKLERYFSDYAISGDYFALIDEAHNLLERVRDNYSSTISLQMIKAAKKSVKNIKWTAYKRSLNRLIKIFEKNVDDVLELSSLPVDCQKEFENLERLHHEKKEDAEGNQIKLPVEVRDFSRELHRFLFLYENESGERTIFFKKDANDIFIKMYCLNPAPFVLNSLSFLKSSILFSGTLSPISYFENSLLGSDNYPSLSLTSPFPMENLRLLIAPNISTRYKDRATTYEDVALFLKSFSSGKVGNYLIFFPSYAYLHAIKPFLSFENAEIIEEKSKASDDEKNAFLNFFQDKPKITHIGLAVLGGSFSESIDLVNERLIGVAIIGIGLPSPSYERELLKNNYEARGLSGYAFAYQNPGLNKVLQALGRLIRSEDDRGVALLIDDRYLYRSTRDVFAKRYPAYEIVYEPLEVEMEVSSFFKKE